MRERRAPGVDAGEVPGHEGAGGGQAAATLDERRRATVRPGELLLAGPANRDGLPGGAGEARRLDGGLGGVLPAEPAAHVGHDHADAVARDAERLGQDLLRPEGPVAAGPDGEAVPAPLGHRGARLHRGVLDEGHPVGLRQDPARLPQGRLHRALLVGAGLASSRLRAQVLEEVVVRDGLGCRLPGGRSRGRVERLRRQVRGRRGEADERPLSNRHDVLHGRDRREIDRLEGGAVRGAAQDPPVQHSGAHHVRGEPVRPGDEVPSIRPRHGLAQGLPPPHGGERHVGPDRLAEDRRRVLDLRHVGVRHRRVRSGSKSHRPGPRGPWRRASTPARPAP